MSKKKKDKAEEKEIPQEVLDEQEELEKEAKEEAEGVDEPTAEEVEEEPSFNPELPVGERAEDDEDEYDADDPGNEPEVENEIVDPHEQRMLADSQVGMG